MYRAVEEMMGRTDKVALGVLGGIVFLVVFVGIVGSIGEERKKQEFQAALEKVRRGEIDLPMVEPMVTEPEPKVVELQSLKSSNGTVHVGQTWDQSLPYLPDERGSLDWQGLNKFVGHCQEKGFHYFLEYQRPNDDISTYDSGQFVLVRIRKHL
jgi:hypothetical protein